jgi:hypothetical protein
MVTCTLVEVYHCSGINWSLHLQSAEEARSKLGSGFLLNLQHRTSRQYVLCSQVSVLF